MTTTTTRRTTALATDARWREQALCAQTDPDLFFPDKGGSSRDAQRVCAACPVRDACLTDALARRDVTFGVLGGLTPRQRRDLLRVQAQVERAERRWAA